jgi:hypothetical protein
MVIFAPQSLIMDPPFTKLDILSCRNLLIYLTPEMQKKLIPLFHYSLSPGGIPVSRQRGDGWRPSPTCLRRSAANCGSSGGRNPSCDRSIDFPSSFAPPLPPGPRPSGTQTAGQSPVTGGSVGAGTLRAAGGAHQ